ncbi:MAG: hypothetical protein HRT83_04215, partial [Hyphomicrobiaceae bacterium]|nr:hypothetical protein [Hyphomicrobiaceae bacterium]
MSQPVHDSENRAVLSANLRATLQRASEYAEKQNHRLVTTEHILLALNEDPEAKAIFEACSVDRNKLDKDVSAHLKALRSVHLSHENTTITLDPEATRIVNSAVMAAEKSRRNKVNGAIVLAAIIGEGKTLAAKFLSSQGLTFQAAISALQTTHPYSSPTSSRTNSKIGLNDQEVSHVNNNVHSTGKYFAVDTKRMNSAPEKTTSKITKEECSLTQPGHHSTLQSQTFNKKSSKALHSLSGVSLSNTSVVAQYPMEKSSAIVPSNSSKPDTNTNSLRQQRVETTSADISTSLYRHSDIPSLPNLCNKTNKR